VKPVLDFIESFDNGTVRLDHSGHGWCVEFYVGYQRLTHHGEGRTLTEAITDAVKRWPKGKEEWEQFQTNEMTEHKP
jgi:hypothetical protein